MRQKVGWRCSQLMEEDGQIERRMHDNDNDNQPILKVNTSIEC